MPTDTEITAEDVIALPPSDEPFDGDAVPVLLDLITDRLRAYVTQQAESEEPVSLLGFAVELIYQTGVTEGASKRRRQ
jgi:hypothetical protein